MDCHSVENLSSAYIDHELSMPERQAVEAHMSGCASCRSLYEDLQRMVSGVKSLPPLDPHERLWLRLQGRISEESAAARARSPRKRFLQTLTALWRWPRHPIMVWSAALVLIVFSTLLLTWRMGVQEKPAEEVALAEIRQAEQHYQKAIDSLNQILLSRKSSWDPQFNELVEANFKKIDQAIAECQAAVKRYPSDPEAAQFLLAAYSRKVDFLLEILQIRS